MVDIESCGRHKRVTVDAGRDELGKGRTGVDQKVLLHVTE